MLAGAGDERALSIKRTLTRQHSVMASTVYAAYLLALLVVPLLVRRRWGVVAALLVSAAEVGLVALLSHWIIPANPYPVGSPIGSPAESPLEQIRRSQAYGYAMVITWVMFPAIPG